MGSGIEGERGGSMTGVGDEFAGEMGAQSKDSVEKKAEMR